MSDFKNFLTVMGVIFLVGLCLIVGYSIMFPFGNLTQGDEIAMVQPSGWNFWRDSYAAQEINQPNSEANLNNGMAHQANAEATLASAQALQVQRETGLDPKVSFAAGLQFGCMGVIALLFIVAAVAIRTGGKP